MWEASSAKAFRRADRGQHEPLVPDPAVVFADFGKFGDRSHRRVVQEQQVEHRHEVRLTRAEAAVQVAGLAVGGVDRAANESERIIEAGDQLRRDTYWARVFPGSVTRLERLRTKPLCASVRADPE